MLHFLTAGHIDEAAARRGELRVLASLDNGVATRLLDQYRDRSSGEITFAQRPVELRDGCVRCPWYTPQVNLVSIKFVLALQAETRCVIADIEHGRIVTPAELAALLPKVGDRARAK